MIYIIFLFTCVLVLLDIAFALFFLLVLLASVLSLRLLFVRVVMCLFCCFSCCEVLVGVLYFGKIGVRKAGKMVLGYGRSAKLNFRAYRNPFRF